MKHPYECNSPQHELSRRQWLGSMAGATAGVGMSSLLEPAIADELKSRQQQFLVIWLDGGISQLESWDPKPGTEFGGPYRAIPTKLPGVHVSELMPKTAQQMHRLSVVRNMCTKDENQTCRVAFLTFSSTRSRTPLET